MFQPYTDASDFSDRSYRTQITFGTFEDATWGFCIRCNGIPQNALDAKCGECIDFAETVGVSVSKSKYGLWHFKGTNENIDKLIHGAKQGHVKLPVSDSLLDCILPTLVEVQQKYAKQISQVRGYEFWN